MKFDFAIFTTDGEETDIPVPIAISKIKEVAGGTGHFTCEEDKRIAGWMLDIIKILALR